MTHSMIRAVSWIQLFRLNRLDWIEARGKIARAFCKPSEKSRPSEESGGRFFVAITSLNLCMLCEAVCFLILVVREMEVGKA